VITVGTTVYWMNICVYPARYLSDEKLLTLISD